MKKESVIINGHVFFKQQEFVFNDHIVDEMFVTYSKKYPYPFYHVEQDGNYIQIFKAKTIPADDIVSIIGEFKECFDEVNIKILTELIINEVDQDVVLSNIDNDKIIKYLSTTHLTFLDEMDLKELINDFETTSELIEKLRDAYLTHNDKQELKDLLDQELIEINTMFDQMKYDLFVENFNKISLTDLEKLVK